MSARLPNRSFSAPLEVPVLQPSHGQDPSFPTPEGIVGSYREFQGDGMDWVPSDSRTPFPNAQGELPVFREASELGSGSAQAPPASVMGPAQPAEIRRKARISFDLHASPSQVDPDAEGRKKRIEIHRCPLLRLQARLSFALSISFMTNTPNLVLFLLLLSLLAVASSRYMRSLTCRRLRVLSSACIPGSGSC